MPQRKLFYAPVLPVPLQTALAVARSEGCAVEWSQCAGGAKASTVVVTPAPFMYPGTFDALRATLVTAGMRQLPGQDAWAWCSCLQGLVA